MVFWPAPERLRRQGERACAARVPARERRLRRWPVGALRERQLGIAVAADDALVVPTIFDADRKSLGEIARESRRLAGRVRDATVTPPELAGGTFTVSNLGMFGISEFNSILNPPGRRSLSAGEIKRGPVEWDGEIALRHVMTLRLTCDHRILYGADAAGFLRRIKELPSSP